MRNKTNIVLIGMPGAGKSTVGAKLMGLDFVDVDLVICRRCGGNLQGILERLGHDEFLRAEGEAALSLECENSVIATGGSMVYSEAAMKRLGENGVTVYLKTELDELRGRIKNLSDRGIAFREGETLDDIYRERTPLYEKWADITVTGGGRIEDTAFKIKEETEKELSEKR